MSDIDKVFERLVHGKPSYHDMCVKYAHFLAENLNRRYSSRYGKFRFFFLNAYDTRKFFRKYGWTYKEFTIMVIKDDLGWP